MKNQTIGVEIEMTGIRKAEAAVSVKKALDGNSAWRNPNAA